MERMQLHEDRIGGQHVFSGRVVNLKVDQIRLPNGHTSIREVIEHPGGVTVAALTEQDEVLMVRQFRYPFQNVLLELPAGKLEPGETPWRLSAGSSWRRPAPAARPTSPWARSYATPAYCTEQIHIWACRITSRGEQHLDPDEFLEVEAVPLERAVELVLSNQIPDAKTQIGILKTYALVKGGKL